MKIEDFNKDNCALYTPIEMFMGIYRLSGGNPCNGCAYVPECENYYRLNPDKTMPAPQKQYSAPSPRGTRKNKNKTVF